MMTPIYRRTGAFLVAAVLMLWSSQASAQIPLDIGFSVKVGVGGGGVPKPSEKTFDGMSTNIIYPGFGGVSWGLGFFIEPRILGMIGLELGFIYEESTGEGDLEVNNVKTTLNLSSQDLIIPLHIKALIPAGIVSVGVGIGPDFIVHIGNDLVTDGPLQAQSGDRSDNVHLGFELLLEIDLGVVRIPIDFRGRYNPDLSDDLDSRLGSLSPYEVLPNWKWQGMLMIGVTYPLSVM